MPANPTKPTPVEPPPLATVPTLEDLRANASFMDWHKQPFMRQMTAALRASSPISTAIDPHAMIRDGGVVSGWLSALNAIEIFCQPAPKQDDKTKPIPYAGDIKLD